MKKKENNAKGKYIKIYRKKSDTPSYDGAKQREECKNKQRNNMAMIL